MARAKDNIIDLDYGNWKYAPPIEETHMKKL